MLATTTLPWPATDPSRFSSIHSNPPWKPTDRPEVVLNRFGRGRAIYTASLLENVDGLAETYVRLVRLLAGQPSFTAVAPPPVELTVFHQPDRHRYLLSLVNFQKDLPNIPIEGIEVRAAGRSTGRREQLRRVVRLPDGVAVDHQTTGGTVTFRVPRLETLAMFALETM